MSTRRSARKRPGPQFRCLFCGGGPPSDEHIFGDWLRRHGNNGPGVRVTSSGWARVPSARKGGPFTKTVPGFCRRCNNGWMSQLETAAQPVLVSLFDAAEAHQVVLEREQQVTLAQWAFKTVVVACALDGPNHLPAEHIRQFYDDVDPPAQCWIRVGRAGMSTHPEHGAHLGGVKVEPRTAHVHHGDQTHELPAYQARIRLLGVLFDVFGYLTEPGGLELELEPSPELARVLLPIWPVEQERLWWPPARTADALGRSDGPEQTPLRAARVPAGSESRSRAGDGDQ